MAKQLVLTRAHKTAITSLQNGRKVNVDALRPEVLRELVQHGYGRIEGTKLVAVQSQAA